MQDGSNQEISNFVKLRVTRVGICGSDIQRLDMGQSVQSLGHEIVGTHDGTPYVVNPLIVCGECAYCMARETRFCTALRSFGKDGTGGFAGGEIEVPESNLVRLDADENVYTLADPVACVIHALSLLTKRLPRTVLIIGDGTMALLCAELLLQQDVMVVQAIKKESRRQRAHSGAAVILYESIETERYDSVIVCVGGTSAATLNKAANATKAAGMVLVVGAYHRLDDSLAIKTFLKKEITLQGSFSFEPSDFWQAVSVIKENVAFFRTIISKEFPASDIADAIRYHRDNDDRRKVVVSFAD